MCGSVPSLPRLPPPLGWSLHWHPSSPSSIHLPWLHLATSRLCPHGSLSSLRAWLTEPTATSPCSHQPGLCSLLPGSSLLTASCIKPSLILRKLYDRGKYLSFWRQKVATTQISINWWTDKQNVIYPYHGILLGHKNRMQTGHMLQHCWTLVTLWQAKGYCTFMWNLQKRQIHRQKVVSWLPGPGGMGRWGVTANGFEISFWGDENILKLKITQLCEYTKNYWTIHY